ncbi:hypothetical protein DM558_01065 [Entomomonas moraniae]|uniref:Immunity protein 30 domain-containing protein n=1 Tax=Entomomonas moraniae TaxID=2213226 RepID=A0A3S9XAH3_9GAMM|nr:Imm30 family immunity protein [Entomomonas moraniae]AZS49452.1 hypothetical protein DM558_01065 [Entomomonas moraniae]
MSNNLVSKLTSASKLETDEDIDLFFDTIQNMALSKNSEYIAIMLSYLDDNFNTYNDVMSTIIGMAETFPAQDYVKAVIQSINPLKTKAADWLEYIHTGIFNTESYIEIYKKTFCSIPENEQLIVKDYLTNQFLKNKHEKKDVVEYIISC